MTTHTTRVLGAALAALCLGAAAACGTETTTLEPATSIHQSTHQEQSRTSPRVAEHESEQHAGRALCQRHPDGIIACLATPSPAARAGRPGSQKFPDLHP